MFLRVELFASKLIHTYFGYASIGPKNMKFLAKRNWVYKIEKSLYLSTCCKHFCLEAHLDLNCARIRNLVKFVTKIDWPK